MKRLISVPVILAFMLLSFSCNKSDKQSKTDQAQGETSKSSLAESFKEKKVYAIGLTGQSWETGSSFKDYYTNFQGKTYEWDEDDDSMVLISKQPDQKGNINKTEMFFRQSPQHEDGVILYKMTANGDDLNDKELYQTSLFYADFMQKLKKHLKKTAKNK